MNIDVATQARSRNRYVWMPVLCVIVATVWVVGVPAQQGLLSPTDLKALATAAKTSQDHAKLAAHYNAHAAEHEADAKLHEQLGTLYDKASPQLAGEARHDAAHSEEAAEALRNLAKIHEGMAKGK